MNRWIELIILVLVLTVMNGCASSRGTRIDNIPMYGQPEISRPDILKEADDNFIKEAVTGFHGSREEASKAWAKVANDFFNKGNLDYAMRRYNQAWLLNDKNYSPYWGFGQIMIVEGKIEEAIKFYEKARSLIDDEYQKPALLLDLGIAYSYKAQGISNDKSARDKYFGIANTYFRESAQLDNTFEGVWEGWANSLYRENKYKESWEKVKKARSMGYSVHPKFLESLNKAMPEPN